jgi:hypothetical protein
LLLTLLWEIPRSNRRQGDIPKRVCCKCRGRRQLRLILSARISAVGTRQILHPPSFHTFSPSFHCLSHSSAHGIAAARCENPSNQTHQLFHRIPVVHHSIDSAGLLTSLLLPQNQK